MSDTYIPTTMEVEKSCRRAFGPARFYAWLAAHDAEIAAKALSDAAVLIKQERPEMGMHILPTPYRDGKCHGLDLAESIVRARAAEYRKAVRAE